jgi:protein-glutamine gamma-glutamyltransferase
LRYEEKSPEPKNHADKISKMKTPPLLMGATLLFWGWQSQSHFLPEAAAMALILENSRFIKARWEFSDDEFGRVWTFCWVLFLAVTIFAFNSNSGLSDFSQLLQNPNATSERNAGNASTLTVDAVIRCFPMIFFLFIVAQTFSPGNNVPLDAFSPYLRSRMKKARKRGQALPPSRRFDFSYPYFALCLFSASGHASQDDYFYYGLCVLILWALWPQRSRRFILPVFFGTFAVAATAGYWGQHGFIQLVRMAGEYDPQFLSFFWHPRTNPEESMTSIGNIGRMKLSGKIVIRLQPENGAAPPVYLREASYRKLEEISFHDHRQLSWDAGITNNDFPGEVSETPRDSGTWPLYRSPANRSLVNIACYLDGMNQDNKDPQGLLPLPADCNRLENFHAYFVYQNNIGAVRAEGPRLAIFDARFGSGSIMDAPPESDTYTTNQDLFVPPGEVPALRQVISQLDVSGKNDEEKISAIAGFFANNFTYSLWQDVSKSFSTNNTPLARFLLDTRSGHCEYFATATVLLLRELDIPARYAVGYYVHEKSSHGYVVRMRDGHAWCLVWDKKNHVWQNFDTTPGTWIEQEEERASPFQFLSDFQSWAEFETLKFFYYSHSNIREYVFWALIPALAFLLYRIFRSSHRHKKDEEPVRTGRPGLDSEFYRLEQKLTQMGPAREPGEPLSIWLQRATKAPRLAPLKQPLENLLLLHYRYRFDPGGLDPAERRALRREVEECLLAASDRS